MQDEQPHTDIQKPYFLTVIDEIYKQITDIEQKLSPVLSPETMIRVDKEAKIKAKNVLIDKLKTIQGRLGSLYRRISF